MDGFFYADFKKWMPFSVATGLKPIATEKEQNISAAPF